MKTFKLTLVILLFGFGTLTAQEVAADRNLNVDLSEYSTFDWSSHAANQYDIFFLSDALIKHRIREAVQYELEARGFEYTQNNADLVVNFRVFEEPVTMQGYTETFTDENYWGPNEIRKDAMGLVPEPEVREVDEQEKYFMDAGSLMIQLVDRTSGQLVWQGYITEMMTSDENNKVQRSVHKIFDQEFNYESSSETGEKMSSDDSEDQ
jgi:hypothetical protein